MMKDQSTHEERITPCRTRGKDGGFICNNYIEEIVRKGEREIPFQCAECTGKYGAFNLYPFEPAGI